MDTEIFFLYLFLLALGVLALIAGHHFLSSFGRKKGSKKAVMEMGTSPKGDVDYDWIPKETLNELSKLQSCVLDGLLGKVLKWKEHFQIDNKFAHFGQNS